MAGLKELRTRIDAIKSTQKITSAMKMVAASRLRKVQLLIDKNFGYAQNLRRSALRVLQEIEEQEKESNIKYIRPALLQNSANPQNYTLYVLSSNRGLCGAYNGNVAKQAIKRINELQKNGKHLKVICYGKKAYDILKRSVQNVDIALMPTFDKDISYSDLAEDLAKNILNDFVKHKFDVCEFVYAKFNSAISRDFICSQVCPINLNSETEIAEPNLNKVGDAYYEYLPDKLSILEQILPIIFVDNVFRILVNSATSEHSARMSSMDSATRNAKQMISDLTLKYNSLRQSAITTELIEIIAGSEAV